MSPRRSPTDWRRRDCIRRDSRRRHTRESACQRSEGNSSWLYSSELEVEADEPAARIRHRELFDCRELTLATVHRIGLQLRIGAVERLLLPDVEVAHTEDERRA